MNIRKFLTYICYSRDCPSYVNPNRWIGMLAWYDNNIGYK